MDPTFLFLILKLNTTFYYIVRFTILIMRNNIILLNVFTNNTIINLAIKQYKTLDHTFPIILFIYFLLNIYKKLKINIIISVGLDT